MPGIDAADLELIVSAAEAAGQIARRYHGAAPQVWEKDDNQGPVSEADLAVDGMLRSRLISARPDYGWLSEETEDNDSRLTTSRQFIVDPIDGTRAFIEGARDWSHSIAVAHGGQIVAAAVYLPLREAMFSASLGGGARLNGGTIAVSAEDQLDRANVLANRVTMAPENWRDAEPPPVTRHFRSSLAYRMCLVAQGRFDAMLTFRPTWEWDIAAGALIVQEAGGTVTDRHGRELKFNRGLPQADGVVAGGALHPALVAELGSPG
ncbi:3'(2'),5'-bisphosphate nucleotidase CysQ [Roseisalinus antarcticus]|uniref:Inositol-1-monophosphatase n=1 Tax=Roseisalinus antarcticus TaxID=254357 RepID=A0A1Y5SLW4_9RHOB|nr:3'(2'),5'-bisphosphate nucleotidase CysQ [Roseisalinus antarcticus]SLN42623.1 Inositol-1-monophosphatase [Roseisalinus antarcticus]